MQVQPPPFGDVVASLVYLAVIVVIARFSLRWFLGVRALQRKCEQQALTLEVMAKRLAIDLPAEQPREGIVDRARAIAIRMWSRAAALLSRMFSKAR
ncbi:hypothetical protein [Burkholderia arboris]|uniref:hypothetical protein n=1 Tax=Burkholderia arboris TaxID=488730 RepID=UPI001CF57E69|nr:hypothetical protein [Burkholderia arboris]MCA8050814.1 hypothetical protein [Burkholderia arboris]